MSKERISVTILVAEDDEDDRLIISETLAEAGLANEIKFVADGEELMAYLKGEGVYDDPYLYPRPGLILLDINMPRKSGPEALREIKADPELERIPVFVLTTSDAEEDIHSTYELGSSSFIQKPVSLEALVDRVRTLTRFRLEIVDPSPNWRDLPG